MHTYPQKSPVLPYEVASTNPYFVGSFKTVVNAAFESQIHVLDCGSNHISVVLISVKGTYASGGREVCDALCELGVEPGDDSLL